ncbi:MAG TPA: hypothetical protein VJA66_14030 [Thermoanaerobaculia bacterium]
MRIGAFAMVVACLAGLFAVWACHRFDLGARLPQRSNIFFFLYQTYESPHLILAGLFGLAVLLVARRRGDIGQSARPEANPSFFARPWAVLLLAAAVVLLAGLGENVWLKNYPFAMDEYAPTFQAEIFAKGQWAARLPEVWRPFLFALSPIFILVDRGRGTWSQAYFPVYAAIRSLFLLAGLERWTNPVLAGMTIVALAAVARILWPAPKGFFLAPVALLACSPQFLVNSMTAYSMPAHLLFNLVWLGLWLRKDRVGTAVAPWIGFLAVGLHNPLPHLLFAAPFLLRELLRRKWKLLSYVMAVYGAGVIFWWWLLQRVHPLLQGSGILSQFSVPARPGEWLMQLMHGTLLFSWLTPAAVLFFVAGVASWRRLPEAGKDLVWGVLLTFAFYVLYPRGQGHGWGYRYVYGVLGNVVLVAAYGLETLAAAAFFRRRILLVASAALSLFVSLPLRGREIREVMAPFIRASEFIATLKGRVVLIDVRTVWYVQDLVRNDPFLRNDPKIMFADRIRAKRPALETVCPGCARELTAAELVSFGFPDPSGELRLPRP